jgi:hypothetical protein
MVQSWLWRTFGGRNRHFEKRVHENQGQPKQHRHHEPHLPLLSIMTERRWLVNIPLDIGKASQVAGGPMRDTAGASDRWPMSDYPDRGKRQTRPDNSKKSTLKIA